MKSLRLAIFTNRFWPHIGPTEMEVADLAEALTQAGHQVEVISIRRERAWPDSFRFRNFQVSRVYRSTSGPWGMFRFTRRLTVYLQDLQPEGMVVFGLNTESWAVVRSLASTVPMVLRIDRQVSESFSRRALNTNQRQTLQLVKAVLADSRDTANWLQEVHGVAADAIDVMPTFVAHDPEYKRSLTRQGTARLTLSDAHPILQVDPVQPLVVCAASRFDDDGMLDLLTAWSEVLAHYPTARLWIIGDGPKGRRIWEKICELGIADSVVMPGYFDALDDLFQAADVYIHPLQSSSHCGGLVRALMAGVCAIATKNATTEGLIKHQEDGLLTTAADPDCLQQTMRRALQHVDLRDRLGRAARRRAISQFELSQSIQRVLNPLQPMQPFASETEHPLS